MKYIENFLMIVLDSVACVLDAVPKKLKFTSVFVVEVCFRPVALSTTPRAMPAEIHLAPFVAALREILE